MSDSYSPIELLPHRDGMLLIDKVIGIHEEGASGETLVSEDRLFVCPQNGLPWWASIELMAQTVGLWVGDQRLQNGEPIKLGFLLGARSFQATGQYFALKSTIKVNVEAVMVESGGICVFDCSASGIDGEGRAILATAKLKAIQPDNVTELLAQMAP